MANTAGIKRGWNYDTVNGRLSAYVDGLEAIRLTPSSTGVDLRILGDTPASNYINYDGGTDTLTTTGDLNITGDVTITGDLDISTEDIFIDQGQYFWLDGESGGEYLRSDAANYLMLNATTGINLAIGGTDELNITATGIDFNDNAITDMGDITFHAASVLASGSTNTNTLLFKANDTTFITLTTGTTDTMILGKAFFYDAGGEYIESNGSALTIAGSITFPGALSIDDTTDSSSTTTGSVHTDGGLGVAKKAYIGTDLDVGGATQLDGAVTIGADAAGVDTILYGAVTNYKVWFDANGDTNGAVFFGADTYGIQTTFYGDTTGCTVVFDPSTDTNGTWSFGASGGSKGVDVVFYGDTNGATMTWDRSADALVFAGLPKIDIGSSGTPIVLTAGAPIFELYSTSGDTTSTNSEPFYVQSTMTGAGGHGGRAKFYLAANAALGGWSNALKAQVVYDNAGSTSGMGSAFCAELELSTGTTGGTYAPVESELVANTGDSLGTGTGFFYCNAGGTAADDIDSGAYLFIFGAGLDAASGKFFDTDKTTHNAYAGIPISIEGVGTKYIPVVDN